jgi:hypothetical protein
MATPQKLLQIHELLATSENVLPEEKPARSRLQAGLKV